MALKMKAPSARTGLYSVASYEFNDDSKDPNQKQSRDGIELNSRINELTEDDHQCDRKDRKDSVPGGNIAKVVFLGQDGVRIDVVVLLVIVLLNKVMADSNNDQSRDGNPEAGTERSR